MKKEVRFHFDSSDFPGGAQAILAAAGIPRDMATVDDVPVLGRVSVEVTLEETDPRVPVLLQLLKPYDAHPTVRHIDHYTDDELEGARLLFINVYGPVFIGGGVAYGTKYDFSQACPACGTGARQASGLFVDYEELNRLSWSRVCPADWYNYVLVDGELAADLSACGATGLVLRSVFTTMPDGRTVELPWKQLGAARTLPPMSPLTTGVDRAAGACKVCRRDGYGHISEHPPRVVYRDAELRGADDLLTTWEHRGVSELKPNLRDSTVAQPWLLVTPKVYRVFRDAGVTELEFLPIRMEDGSGVVHMPPHVAPPVKLPAPAVRRPKFFEPTEGAVSERAAAYWAQYYFGDRENLPPLVIEKDTYTEEQLDSARLLVLNGAGDAMIDGGAAWGTLYDRSAACQACGTGARQTSPLFVNGEELASLEGQRAAMTPYGHMLVDDDLAKSLSGICATGLSFRSVYAVMPDRSQIELGWKQVCAERTLRRMAPGTSGVGRSDVCWVCRRQGHSHIQDRPLRIVYRASDLRDADEVNMTWENQGHAEWKPEVRDSKFAYPWFLVTPKVRRVFRDAGVTSFEWIPIRVEE